MTLGLGVALLGGTALGLVAGYRRGLADATLMRIMDGLLAVPTLVLALAITSDGKAFGGASDLPHACI